MDVEILHELKVAGPCEFSRDFMLLRPYYAGLELEKLTKFGAFDHSQTRDHRVREVRDGWDAWVVGENLEVGRQGVTLFKSNDLWKTVSAGQYIVAKVAASPFFGHTSTF